jgi:hypothetical protein
MNVVEQKVLQQWVAGYNYGTVCPTLDRVQEATR